MHKKKSKKVLIYFFLLIIFSSISNNSFNNFKLYKTLNISLSGLDSKNNQNLLNEIENLSLKNIFFIEKNEIVKLISSNPLIERYEVFKKYPSTINIKIKKTNFLAKINHNGKNYLIGSNGKFILNENYNIDLPFIFGKPNVNEFLKLKKIIEESKLSYNQIKNFYFFQSKRWDLRLKDDILLRLPSKLTNKTLDQLQEFLENYDGDNFFSLDARIENQIILNE